MSYNPLLTNIYFYVRGKYSYDHETALEIAKRSIDWIGKGN